MIVVTGAGGFIGSSLINRLNFENENEIIAVDSFDSSLKYVNIRGLKIKAAIDRDELRSWLDKNHKNVRVIFHMGARTDTGEQNFELLSRLNTDYTKLVWKRCAIYGIPLIYASSAATYGNGKFGFIDDESRISSLEPLTPYAVSKHSFDLWAIQQKEKPPFWAGLKFFNVYGPNEYNKGHMASVVFHGFNQIKTSRKISLFRSHNALFNNGEQMRDFVYIKDITSVCIFLMENFPPSGIYNVGTGNARTFLDLAHCLFSTLQMQERIDFVEIPISLRDHYQYYTNAHVQKLRHIGYEGAFYSLEEGVKEYVTQYLLYSRAISHN